MTHETEQVRSCRHQRSASVVFRQPIDLPEHDLATRLQVLVKIGLWIERHGGSLPLRSPQPEVPASPIANVAEPAFGGIWVAESAADCRARLWAELVGEPGSGQLLTGGEAESERRPRHEVA